MLFAEALSVTTPFFIMIVELYLTPAACLCRVQSPPAVSPPSAMPPPPHRHDHVLEGSLKPASCLGTLPAALAGMAQRLALTAASCCTAQSSLDQCNGEKRRDADCALSLHRSRPPGTPHRPPPPPTRCHTLSHALAQSPARWSERGVWLCSPSSPPPQPSPAYSPPVLR